MPTKSEEKKPEYKNENVHVIVHRKPGCVVEYEVHALRPICNEAQKKAAKSVGKEVVVPGFRKGKAPVEIVAKRYPHELDKRWQEGIANACFKECAQLAQVPLIRPDANITFKMDSHSRDGAKLTLSFETIPEIPSIDPAKFVLDKVKSPEVSKDKIEETIRQTQMFFAKWNTVESRPIKEGDFLILDVDIIEEDPPESLFKNTRFEVSDRSMAQWMKKLLIGKKSGEVVEGVSIPDESLSEEEKKEYLPKKMRVNIKAIEEATLPELNDEFVKQLGVETVDEFRTRIGDLLTKKASEHVQEAKREKVTEFLLSHDFELPSSVIEKEAQFRLEQMIQDPHFKKQWDASTDQQKRELIDSTKAQAEKAVRIFYICRKIAADQNISISAKDVEAVPSDILESLLFPSQEPHDPRQPEVKQAESYSKVLLDKTEDWVIAHARSAPEKPKAEKQPAAKKTTKAKTATKSAKSAAPKKKAAKTAEAKPKAKKKVVKKATKE